MINQTNQLYRGLFSDKITPSIDFKAEASTTVVQCNVLQLLKYFYRCKSDISFDVYTEYTVSKTNFVYDFDFIRNLDLIILFRLFCLCQKWPHIELLTPKDSHF